MDRLNTDNNRQARFRVPLIFEKSKKGRKSNFLPPLQEELSQFLTVGSDKLERGKLTRKSRLELPELSELEVIRHYTRLSQMNFGVNSGFYPLGSCTMKYNPVVNEILTSQPSVTEVHPDQPESTVQGYLEMYYHVQKWMGEILGLPAVSLQPAAGAQGELSRRPSPC